MLLAVASPALSQVANPTAMTFNSQDHATPALTTYRGLVFTGIQDPAVSPPTITGAVVPKANVQVIAATPTDYRLTFAQMGITLPTCTALPCPQYRMLIEANGPNGPSVRSAADASAPFTASLPSPPDAPTNLRPN